MLHAFATMVLYLGQIFPDMMWLSKILHAGYVTQFLQYVYNTITSHEQHYLCTGNWSAWIVLDSREELLWSVLTPSCCGSCWTPPDSRIPGTLPQIHFTCLVSVYSPIEYVVSSTKYQTVLVIIDRLYFIMFYQTVKLLNLILIIRIPPTVSLASLMPHEWDKAM